MSEAVTRRPMTRQPITRRRVLICGAALLALPLLAACEKRAPIQLEGKGGSSSKTRIKILVPYFGESPAISNRR